MPTYNVELSRTVTFSTTVEAISEDVAIESAVAQADEIFGPTSMPNPAEDNWAMDADEWQVESAEEDESDVEDDEDDSEDDSDEDEENVPVVEAEIL